MNNKGKIFLLDDEELIASMLARSLKMKQASSLFMRDSTLVDLTLFADSNMEK